MNTPMATSNAAVLSLLPLPSPSVRSGGGFQNKAVHNRPKRVSVQVLPCNTRRVKLHANISQARSRHIRCAAALNATCAAAATQPATRESRTITVIPGKAKTPQIDDNGPGLPPYRDDGNGGNGGGGGGKSSGGLVLLGILGALDVLKEIEKELRGKNDE